jgi:ribosomal 50S subunit-associated protein YjgA (DUF615 family)
LSAHEAEPRDGASLGRRLRARDLEAAPAALNVIERRHAADGGEPLDGST